SQNAAAYAAGSLAVGNIQDGDERRSLISLLKTRRQLRIVTGQNGPDFFLLRIAVCSRSRGRTFKQKVLFPFPCIPGEGSRFQENVRLIQSSARQIYIVSLLRNLGEELVPRI